jgi:poly(beta-D-mannuronate) lyase
VINYSVTPVSNKLFFRNGFTPSKSVIEFRIIKNQLANNCRVTNCVIDGFNQFNRARPDHWVEFWGRHNKFDHCYIAGKSNQGPTVRVFFKGNESIINHHQIINNHFGPRPRKGGPKTETILILKTRLLTRVK